MNTHTWRCTGAWPGGTVHSIAFSGGSAGSFALAATAAGVFRSTDGGRAWGRVSAHELSHTASHAVAVAPGNRSGNEPVAFATTTDGSLFRSNDAGISWQRMSSWAFGTINALALSPNFGADHTLFAATTDGIYRSMDGGLNWQSASFGLLDGDVLCLTCAPDFVSSEVVWAGSATGGLYRSRNAGRAWRESGEGLADSAVQCIVCAGAALLVGTEGGGVFRSMNGAKWEASGLDGLVVNCLVVGEGSLLAGTGEGIFLSDDDGRSWQHVMVNDAVLALALLPDGSVVAGGAMTGVTVSTDAGRHWQFLANANDKGLSAHVPPLATHLPDGALFAFDMAGGAAWSTDDGASWHDIALNDGPIECTAAGGTVQHPILLAATAHGVLHWQNNAFEPLAAQPELGDADAIRALAATPDGTLLVGTQRGSASVSTDGGATWQPVVIPGTGAVTAIQLTLLGSLFVLRFASSGDDAFDAEVWHLPTLVLPMVQQSPDWHLALALDALQSSLACMTIETVADRERVVLAGQNVIAVHALSDGQTHRTNLPGGTTITSLVAGPGQMFVGTNRGIFTSVDSGITWQMDAHQPGAAPVVPVVPVVALCAHARGLSAIALGGEVWHSSFAG